MARAGPSFRPGTAGAHLPSDPGDRRRTHDLAPQLGAGDRTAQWAAALDKIRAAILERGWNEQAGAFTQAFGSADLDASSLMLAITGFLPGGDPRMKATVDAIATRLTDPRGLIYRYLA